MGGPGAAVAIASPSADMGAGAESADETSVTIADFAFAPQELTVEAGTTVTWTNEDWALAFGLARSAPVAGQDDADTAGQDRECA